MVKEGVINSIFDIFKYSIPIREVEIVDKLVEGIEDRVVKVASV